MSTDLPVGLIVGVLLVVGTQLALFLALWRSVQSTGRSLPEHDADLVRDVVRRAHGRD